MEINNFIRTIIEEDLKAGRNDAVLTRFPPEPNSYLHIGHARAIVTNFELAKVFGGGTNLRFDDTNPEKEEAGFVAAIEEDVRWLGYEPRAVLFGSDYFEKSYELAVGLIKQGLAYVDSQTAEQISATRGTLTRPGTPSPDRDRSVAENLALFAQMRAGKFAEGEKVLRAKIDMAHSNINMRDPVLYRISYSHHHRQGDAWCIYPMYDFAHPIQDALEGVTHSLCSLEFENHRILYDWVVEHCGFAKPPKQIEFGRLNITHMLTSKRYLRQLVEAGLVEDYSDPRLPTLRGLRKRGVRPAAIREFILATGLSRINSTVALEMFEHFIREDLKLTTPRIMAVTDPLLVTITNYPAGQVETLEAPVNPEAPEMGTHDIYFSREIYIERADFLKYKPNKKYRRLALGEEVRLMNAYFIKAVDVVEDETGRVIEVRATYDPETRSGSGFADRKPNGTIGFVEKSTAVPATFKLFKPLLMASEPDPDRFLAQVDPESLLIRHGFVPPRSYRAEERMQFMRDGYYYLYDRAEMIFHQIVPLKSTYHN